MQMLKEQTRVVCVGDGRMRHDVVDGDKGTIVMVDETDRDLPYLVDFDAVRERRRRQIWCHAHDVKEIIDYDNYNLR